jgi:hypothetical protein
MASGTFEEKQLNRFLSRAFLDIQKNAFCGTQLSKQLIPKEYKKFGIDNLWKYDLPDGWRLLYSIARRELIVISIILEWFDHKNYERRFGYK